MATVKIILDKRRAKADGSYPINFQICHQRKTTTRSSKINVLEVDWDDSSKSIKKSNCLHKSLNTKLKKEFADIQSQLLLADDIKVKEFLTPIKEQVEIIEVKKTIYQFAQELINQLRIDNKIGNAWVYESTVNVLKTFHTTDDLYFEAIDYQFLTQYNSFLVKRELKHNTIYLYLRTIRIFYNKAIKSKIVDKGLYPFDDYKLRPEKTKKHLDHNPSNNSIDNLAFLCFDHHDQYDTKTSQSKNLNIIEVKHYKRELNKYINERWGVELATIKDLNHYNGIYLNDGDYAGASLTILALDNNKVQIKGSAVWGKGRPYGPNIGELDFISEIDDNKIKFEDQLDYFKIRIDITLYGHKLKVEESYMPHRFGYFGMNVSFEGEYYKKL
ncbi:phage integrase SAM-like domain and Arm DNA-binding domain-containing protein [Mucilaginibacter mallensis]|nr:phage integrase SAM-like domain and Arm DNA-binding domain-containing protein [Mucilaginibacter mallensis]